MILTRDEDDVVIDKVVGIADARIRIDHIPWYVPHYKPSIQQQSILSNQIIKNCQHNSDMLNDLFFWKKIINQNLWNFELGSQGNMNFPIWIFISFHQRNRQDFQILNNDNFRRLPPSN